MNDDNGLVIDARDVQRTYGAGGGTSTGQYVV